MLNRYQPYNIDTNIGKNHESYISKSGNVL